MKWEIKIFLQIGLYIGLLLSGVSAQTFSSIVPQLRVPGQGNDAQARTDMRSLTHAVMEQGGAVRLTYEGDLTAEIQKDINWQIKAFLMGEIQIVAQEVATIDVLESFLNDDNLDEYAAQALLAMAQEAYEERDSVAYIRVREAVRTKLTGAIGSNRVTLVKAAGSLRDYTLTNSFLADASSSDDDLKFTALRALAQTGDPLARDILKSALTNANSYERSLGVNLNLLYARRLAERNEKALATQVANDVKNMVANAPDCEYFVVAANTTLTEIPGIPISDPWDLPVPIYIRSHPLHGELKAFLHPETGKLIVVVGRDKSYKVSLLDIKGQIVWSAENGKANEFVIPQKLLGTYILQMVGADQSYSQMIFIDK